MRYKIDKLALLIFLLGLLTRAAFVLTLAPDRYYWPDETLYDSIAQSLARGEGFAVPEQMAVGRLGVTQGAGYLATPFWPGFMAAVHALCGPGLRPVRLANALVGALTCVVIWATARRLFGPRVAACAGLLLAVAPPSVYLAGVLYIENFYTLWLAVVAYTLTRLSEQPDWGRAAVAGLALGAATLCRSAVLMLIPFVALVPLLARGTDWRRRLMLTGLMWLTAAAVIAPWTARNWAVFGRLVPVSTGGGLTLWRGNCELSRGDASDRFLDPLDRRWPGKAATPEDRARIEQFQGRLRELDEVEIDKALTRESLAYIRAHPWRCATLYVKKWLELHSAFSRTLTTEHASPGNIFIATAVHYPVLALGFCGMILSLSRWRTLRSIYLIWAVFAFTLPALTASTRVRLPTDPFLMVFASVAGIWMWERLAANRVTAARLAACIGAGLAVRLLWSATLTDAFPWRDEAEYDAIARNLLDRGAYSMDGSTPTAFRAPGQPLFLAAAYALDASPAAARVWQSLLWAVAIWATFKVAREAGASERASLWAAAAVAAYPFYLYAAGTLFPLTLFTVLLLLATWALLRTYNQGGSRPALMGGAALGAGTLTIPYLLPTVLLAPLWLGRQRWRESVCLVAAALALVAPWPLRNWVVFGTPTLGSQQWINLWYGNNPKATASSGSNIPIEPLAFWERYDRVFRTNEVAGDALLRDDAVRHIREHPCRTAGLWASKALNFFRLWPLTQTQNAHTTLATKLLAALTFGPILSLALIGWWRAILDRRRAMIIVIYFATFVAVSAVTISKDRFRIPLDVYLIIFAAAVVERWFSRYNPPSDTDTTRPC